MPDAVLIEPHPIDGEALRDDLVAVNDEQPPTVMCVVVAASLARPPDAAAYGRPEPQWRSGGERDASDQARELGGALRSRFKEKAVTPRLAPSPRGGSRSVSSTRRLNG